MRPGAVAPKRRFRLRFASTRRVGAPRRRKGRGPGRAHVGRSGSEQPQTAGSFPQPASLATRCGLQGRGPDADGQWPIAHSALRTPHSALDCPFSYSWCTHCLVCNVIRQSCGQYQSIKSGPCVSGEHTGFCIGAVPSLGEVGLGAGIGSWVLGVSEIATDSALRTPHSALRTPHSALRTPHLIGRGRGKPERASPIAKRRFRDPPSAIRNHVSSHSARHSSS